MTITIIAGIIFGDKIMANQGECRQTKNYHINTSQDTISYTPCSMIVKYKKLHTCKFNKRFFCHSLL